MTVVIFLFYFFLFRERAAKQQTQSIAIHLCYQEPPIHNRNPAARQKVVCTEIYMSVTCNLSRGEFKTSTVMDQYWPEYSKYFIES